MSEDSAGGDDYDVISEDHDEIRRQIGVIHGALSARLGRKAEICDMLDAKAKMLARHFAEEEASGFFESIVEQTPRLADRAAKLVAEHSRLLETIHNLADEARRLIEQDGWWERTESRFHLFSKQLMHHETGENHLLQESYGDDIGAED